MRLITAKLFTCLCLMLSLTSYAQSPRQKHQTSSGGQPSRTDTEGKSQGNILSPFPVKWRARFEERLNLFLEAQRNQKWDQVEELLGELCLSEADLPSEDYSVAERNRCSPEQKKWVLDKVKSNPILSFKESGVSWDSEQNNSSQTLKLWYLEGFARYANTTDAVPMKTTIIAYHFNTDWFFIPKTLNKCSEPVFQPPPEFSEREAAESSLPGFSLAPQPDLPMQVFDVSEPVGVQSSCSTNQKVTFKVMNTSGKKIVTYHYVIKDSRGKTVNSGGTTAWLPPGEIYADSGVYFTSRRPCILYFEAVDFYDGTKWQAKSH